MRTGRPIPPLTLTDEERETLERWVRRPTTGQALAQRARLILSCAAVASAPGRPVSESGRLCYGDGAHGRGGRRRMLLMSPSLTPSPSPAR